MTTKIEIASNALILLGDKPISSFSEQGAGPQAAANLYEPIYLNMATSHSWGFSKKQLQLSQNVTPPPFDNYRYSYNLPADMIQAFGLRSNMDYEIFAGGLLYTNDSKAEFTYQIRPDEALVPPYFAWLISVELSKYLAMPVTDRAEVLSNGAVLSQEQWLLAINLDSQSDTNEAVRSSPFTEVRG